MTTGIDLDPHAIATRLATASADFATATADEMAHHYLVDRAVDVMQEEWWEFMAFDESTRNTVTGCLVSMLGSLLVASEAAGMLRADILAALAADDR